MTQLIFDLNPESLDQALGQEAVELALGQLLAQTGLKYGEVRVHGERAYVDFDDSENAKRAYQELNGKPLILPVLLFLRALNLAIASRNLTGEILHSF